MRFYRMCIIVELIEKEIFLKSWVDDILGEGILLWGIELDIRIEKRESTLQSSGYLSS